MRSFQMKSPTVGRTTTYELAIIYKLTLHNYYENGMREFNKKYKEMKIY